MSHHVVSNSFYHILALAFPDGLLYCCTPFQLCPDLLLGYCIISAALLCLTVVLLYNMLALNVACNGVDCCTLVLLYHKGDGFDLCLTQKSCSDLKHRDLIKM